MTGNGRDHGHVVIYTILGCPQCMKAKALLRKANIQYTDVSLDSFPQCHQEVIDRSNGDTSVPQIFFNTVHVGGVQELQNLLDNENAWDSLMERISIESEDSLGPPVPLPTSAIDYSTEDHINEEAVLWVPDEYHKLIRDMRKANIIRDNRVSLLKTYRNSFKGEELVEWIVKEKGLKRREALEIGQELIDRHFGQQTSSEMGCSFSPDRYYQLVEDGESLPLNYGVPSQSTVMSVADFNANFVKIVDPIYEAIVFNDGKLVKYGNLKDNDDFSRYLNFAKDLLVVDPRHSTKEERLTFMVNVYNMMLIHMTFKYGPPQSVWQRRKYINSTYYQIHDHKYALQSILNGILRSNKKGAGMLWKPFGKQDERLTLILPECEPLVLFCLTSGTRSSPNIRTYNIKTAYEEMRQNAKKYLLREENMKLDLKKNTVHLSKLFKWYAEDFGGTPEKIITWILQLFEDDESSIIVNLRKIFYTGNYSIDYIPYDWTYNGKEKKENRSETEEMKKI